MTGHAGLSKITLAALYMYA